MGFGLIEIRGKLKERSAVKNFTLEKPRLEKGMKERFSKDYVGIK